MMNPVQRDFIISSVLKQSIIVAFADLTADPATFFLVGIYLRSIISRLTRFRFCYCVQRPLKA